MEIEAIIPTLPATPAVPAPEAKTPHAVERNLQGAWGAAANASGAAVKAVLAPRAVQTHGKLAFDETINRVVGRVVDETTGETILDIPPAQLKAL